MLLFNVWMREFQLRAHPSSNKSIFLWASRGVYLRRLEENTFLLNYKVLNVYYKENFFNVFFKCSFLETCCSFDTNENDHAYVSGAFELKNSRSNMYFFDFFVRKSNKYRFLLESKKAMGRRCRLENNKDHLHRLLKLITVSRIS